jgi:hypothetical protein
MSSFQIHTIHDYLEYQGVSFENYDSEETLNNITNYIRDNSIYSDINRFDAIMVCLNEGCSEEDYGCFIWDGEKVVHPFYNGLKGSDIDYTIDSSGFFPNTLDVLDMEPEKIRDVACQLSCRNRFEKCVGWTDLSSYIYNGNVNFIVETLYSDRYSDENLTVFKFEDPKVIIYMIGNGENDEQQYNCLNYIRGNKPYVLSSDIYGLYDIKNSTENIYTNLDIYDSSEYIHLIIDPCFVDVNYDSVYSESTYSSSSMSRFSKKGSKGSRKNYVESYNNIVYEDKNVEKCSAITNKGNCCTNKSVKNGLCQTHYNSMRNRSRRN